MQRRLHAWFEHHARDLPWRRNREWYPVWISEIMLQQTQVATVIPYFERFMTSFPSIEALAAASETDVLRHWEGLGYYRRARQLHRAAQVLVQQQGGQFPRTAAEARQLPGIGRYTAGAILSIAFDQREPILEANTRRLLCRLLGYRGDPTSSEGERILWQAATDWLPKHGAGNFNQALMELGAEVCTPRSPNCTDCPVALLCPTRAQGLQEVIPAPSRKKEYVDCRQAALIIRRQGRVLLRQCGDAERWAGMWDFPRFDLRQGPLESQYDEVRRQTEVLTGVAVRMQEHFITLRHTVTRFRITLEAIFAIPLQSPPRRSDLVWSRPADLGQLPLSVTGRKLAKKLDTIR